MSAQRLVHHELCFGCGRTNLFGLLMDVAPAGPGRVRGRGFIKQDHQGEVPGTAHDGIVVAALSEAMSLACGSGKRATSIKVQVKAPVPVGVFLDVEAEVAELGEEVCHAAAVARIDQAEVATGTASYRRP